MGTYNSYYINKRPLVDVFVQDSKCPSKSALGWRCQALFDTGSTISCISLRLAEKLGLESVGGIKYFSASGKSESVTYEIAITFLLNSKPTQKYFAPIKELTVFQKEVLGIPLGNEKNDLLIGIDLISEGNLYLNNDYFSFEVPKKNFIINLPKIKNSKVNKTNKIK